MKVYEKPNIKFESLTVFEKIACSNCWNHNSFVFNNPYDDYKKNPKGDKPLSVKTDGRCNQFDSMIAFNLVLKELKPAEELLFVLQNAGNDGNNTMWRGFRTVS